MSSRQAVECSNRGRVTLVRAGVTAGLLALACFAPTVEAQAFVQGGNAFGATAVLGTTDDRALDVRVNGLRVMRYAPNDISPNVIGGHRNNSASAGVRGATIAGGGVAGGNSDPDFDDEFQNRVTDHYGFVGGGYANQAGNAAGTAADSAFATVGGGLGNVASDHHSTVGGGESNLANGSHSTIAGGFGNETSIWYATIGGGSNNTASGAFATVGGGRENIARGGYSIAGGTYSEARGNYSIALGRRAKTFEGGNDGQGTIVLADSNDFDFADGIDNRFSVRATGGVRLVTAIDGLGAPTAGVSLLSGDSSWNVISDRAAKRDWRPVDGEQVLARLVSVPIGRWSYVAQNPAVEHMGPTAQDFRAAFGLGHDDRTIATVDADGVALAAIQGLNAKLEQRVGALAAALSERDARVDSQAREIAELRLAVQALLAGAYNGAVAVAR